MKKHTISRKLLKIILILGFFTLTAVIAVHLWIYNTVRDRIYAPDEIDPILMWETAADVRADCILVLGAGVRDDGSPSHMLEDRLLTGIDLYERGFSPVMLMSGDHGREEYDEVNAMKDFAVSKGVPADRIFLDHAGFSTYESLYRAKEIFGAERIVIVTQEYHLWRALYTADALGLDAVGVSADLRTYVGQSMRETREIAARMKDFLWCLIRPEPTYLGDTIDLGGDADVTHDK